MTLIDRAYSDFIPGQKKSAGWGQWLLFSGVIALGLGALGYAAVYGDWSPAEKKNASQSEPSPAAVSACEAASEKLFRDLRGSSELFQRTIV